MTALATAFLAEAPAPQKRPAQCAGTGYSAGECSYAPARDCQGRPDTAKEAVLRRLLIIGLDGLNWQLLEPLIEAGIMPNLARMRREGAWGPLTSVIPTQSATAWASFITGQNPARHGVQDFMVRQADGSYRHAKPARASTLWHYVGRSGLSVGVFNFPVTYPPDPVPAGGFLVSGMLSPKGRTFTYPPTLGDEMLAAVPAYRLDLEWQLYSGREGALLRDLTEMTRQRAKAACYLQDRYAPTLLAVAFIGPDRLQHALWRHLDPAHPNYDAARWTARSHQPCLPAPRPQRARAQVEGRPGGTHTAEAACPVRRHRVLRRSRCRHAERRQAALTEALHEFYAALDEAVGQLLASTGDGTTVIALSDHGFQPAAWQFRVDDWLAERGWLTRQAGRSGLERMARRLDTPWVRSVRRRLVKDISRHLTAFAPGGSIDWPHTVAFSPWSAQQGIRLNVIGRDPMGIVPQGTGYQRLRDEIYQALLETVEPRSGRRVVDRVWRREELYSGPFFDAMPDLCFSLRPGFAASPTQERLWAATGWASGDHSLEGMFIAWGPGVRQPVLPASGEQGSRGSRGQVAGAELIDVAPTALYLLGLPVPDSMDGKVLTAALDAAFVEANPLRREEAEVLLPEASSIGQTLTAEEQVDIQERLRGLGYL